jgi:hypothetical protein
VGGTRKQLVARDVTTPPDKDAVVQGAVTQGSSSPSPLNFQVNESGRENHMNEFGPPCPAIFPVSAEKLSTEIIKRGLLKTIAITVFKGICAVVIVVGSLAYINWGWICAQESLLLSLFWPLDSWPPALEIGGYSVVVERSKQGKMTDFMESFASFVRSVRVFMIYVVISGTLVAFFLEVMRFAQGV